VTQARGTQAHEIQAHEIQAHETQPGAWRRFFALALGGALALGLALYLFVVLVDPWGALPISLPLPRVPVSTNARYAHPMLAREARFDSAIIGTSTSRLMKPVELDPLFGAHFVNLAMNDAHAYEEYRLLDVFRRAHKAPRVVLVGLDQSWCAMGQFYSRLSPRPFPEWIYSDSRWHGYAEMFGMYPLQEAVAQAGVLLGLKRPPYGLDGYTRFTPPDGDYDAARAAMHLREDGTITSLGGEGPPEALVFPALDYLRDALAELPEATRKVLWFTPYYVRLIGLGTPAEAQWAECKRRVVALAAGHTNTVVVDFLRPSAITGNPANYWDAHHFREPVANRLSVELAAAALRGTHPDDGTMLYPASQGE